MHADTSHHSVINHVFVDFENVKSVDCQVIANKNLRLYLFLGPQNKKLDIAVVECLLEHAQTVQMIRSPKSGKNALDFVLAYHLGQAVLTEPKAHFHIISKDTGFDALIDLLKSKNIKAKRHNDWTALGAQSPKTHAAPAKPSLSTAAAKMLETLRKAPKSRPKKNKSLITFAREFSGKDKPDADAEKLIAELQKSKALEIDEKGNVSYLI
jgi:hypothetical protein